jgi:hypothetical protein
MTSNHLPGGVDLTAFGRPLLHKHTYDGIGFGLGVSMTVDPWSARSWPTGDPGHAAATGRSEPVAFCKDHADGLGGHHAENSDRPEEGALWQTISQS